MLVEEGSWVNDLGAIWTEVVGALSIFNLLLGRVRKGRQTLHLTFLCDLTVSPLFNSFKRPITPKVSLCLESTYRLFLEINSQAADGKQRFQRRNWPSTKQRDYKKQQRVRIQILLPVVMIKSNRQTWSCISNPETFQCRGAC